MSTSERYIQKISVQKTADGCSPTITCRSGNVGISNLISVAHFPMGGYFISRSYEDSNKQIGGAMFEVHQDHVLQGQFVELPSQGRTVSQRCFNHQETMRYDRLIKAFDLDIQGTLDINRRVYSPNGISPTLMAAMGKGGALFLWL